MMTRESKKPLDLSRCFNDALDVYRDNFLAFFFAAILFNLLSMCTLFVLSGPLWGGIVLMMLRTMTNRGEKARLGDIFAAFDRFGPLVGLFFLMLVPQLLGFALFIVPGLLLATM